MEQGRKKWGNSCRMRVGSLPERLLIAVPQPLYHFMGRSLDAAGLGVMVPDVVAAAKAHGKAAGAQPGSIKLAEQWLDVGFNVISWGADMALYRRCLTTEVAALRAVIAHPRGPAAN